MSVTLGSCAPMFVKAIFTGRNGAGTVSVPGVKTGDLVIWMSANLLGSFDVSSALSADDQVYQFTSADLSAVTITAILVRWV